MAKDSNDKPKYEIPIVIALGELARAVGACATGTTATDSECAEGGIAGGTCRPFGGNTTSSCGIGETAGAACNTGLTAGASCVVGESAH